MRRAPGSLRLVAALGLSACAALASCAAPPAAPPATIASTLHLEPLTDLAPAASLAWLLDLRPRAIATDARLAGPLAIVFPEARLAAFARASGGVDLREADAMVLASYPGTDLLLAHQIVNPARVEAAFRARAVTIEGRAIDGPPGDARSMVTRLWGPTGTLREQLAVFGVEAVGVERGRFGPLRAAELFAEGKLKRASPALRAPPLSRVAELLGDAPVRAFAPGPFEGELAHAVGGLLGATTAVGASARVVAGNSPGGNVGIALHAVLLGAWGQDAPMAADRLRAFLDVAAASGIGRLVGLAHPASGPVVQGAAEALTVDLTLDAAVLGQGLFAATAAEVSEIMAP